MSRYFKDAVALARIILILNFVMCTFRAREANSCVKKCKYLRKPYALGALGGAFSAGKPEPET
jgi:hypothetical protein